MKQAPTVAVHRRDDSSSMHHRHCWSNCPLDHATMHNPCAHPNLFEPYSINSAACWVHLPIMLSSSLRDLTGQVSKTQSNNFAIGGQADIWMGELSQGHSKQTVRRISIRNFSYRPICIVRLPSRLSETSPTSLSSSSSLRLWVVPLLNIPYLLVSRNCYVRPNSGAS